MSGKETLMGRDKLKVAVVGLGLIGGSVTKALARSGRYEIIGFDRDEQVLLDAISCGAIRRKGTQEDLGDSDLVYVCLYPPGTLRFVRENGGYFGSRTVVTDMCGVKQAVYGELSRIAARNGFPYLGSHPMAGKERSSFQESEAGLFFGASYITVCENTGTPAYRLVEEAAREMGFGRVINTTAREHDEMIAFTSQLPHVLACAYVLSPRCLRHEGFSAGSYRDVSRVANINAELWAELFLSNREALIDEIDCLSDNINRIRACLEQEDEEKLAAVLLEARRVKEKDFVSGKDGSSGDH